MALTPEEVVNKRFTIVKFREGYDQDEVDDFLDAVVVELRRLASDNDELRQQLQAAKAQADATPAVSASDFPVAPVVAAAVPSAAEASNSHSLLELARKLHEEHVRDGLTKRDQLIRDGQENSARLVRDAEAQARAVLGQLELDRKAIENTIDELREFEHDYRGRLREYIESQLTTLIREESFEQPLEAAAKIEFAAITEVAAEPIADIEEDEDELEDVATSSAVEDEDETRSERN
jgi:DivIVA domain-containing protein